MVERTMAIMRPRPFSLDSREIAVGPKTMRRVKRPASGENNERRRTLRSARLTAGRRRGRAWRSLGGRGFGARGRALLRARLHREAALEGLIDARLDVGRRQPHHFGDF